MVFPLDVVFYNRVQHDRRNKAASEKVALDKVQPQKEAPEGQLNSRFVYCSWQYGVLEPSLLTSSLTPKEQANDNLLSLLHGRIAYSWRSLK